MNYLTGLVMIKPDGMERGIEKELRKAMNEYNIEIIEERIKRLLPSEVIENFFCNFDKYVEYLTSGICKVFLVTYIDDDDVLYDFKNEFRNQWLSSYKKTEIKNLIHTSDEGLEFFKQVSLFFSDSWSSELCRGSDLLIKNVDCLCVREAIRNSNLKNIGLLIENEQDLFYAKEFVNDYNLIYITKRTCDFGDKIIVLYDYHFNFKECSYHELVEQKRNVLTVLGEIEGLNDYNERDVYLEDNPLEFYERIYHFYRSQLVETMQLLGEDNIQGILIETSKMDLWEANSRYFFADEMNLTKVSGSGSVDSVGKFFASCEMYNEMVGKNG